MGYTLNEYGLFHLEGDSGAAGEKVAGETEESVYQKLGLAWIAPELRENQGEIDAAAEGRLPHLVELSDIRGDLHMHTTETDGRATLEEMAAAARELGYQNIAIPDHSPAACARWIRAGSASACSPASSATSAAMARWT